MDLRFLRICLVRSKFLRFLRFSVRWPAGLAMTRKLRRQKIPNIRNEVLRECLFFDTLGRNRHSFVVLLLLSHFYGIGRKNWFFLFVSDFLPFRVVDSIRFSNPDRPLSLNWKTPHKFSAKVRSSHEWKVIQSRSYKNLYRIMSGRLGTRPLPSHFSRVSVSSLESKNLQ